MAERLPRRRRLRPPASLARGALAVVLVAGISVAGYHALRLAGACVTLDSARAVIEDHVRGRHVDRIARVLKTADRQLLASRTAVRVTALSCGPSLLGGMTCRARYEVNEQSVEMGTADHYFRIGYSLLVGWQGPGTTETSRLRYSLTPGRCSWSPAAR